MEVSCLSSMEDDVLGCSVTQKQNTMDETDYKAINKQENGNDFIADVSGSTFSQEEEELQRLVRKIKWNQPTYEDLKKADELTRKKWSSWTEREHGDIKIKHHGTSSLIEMTITTDEEVQQGKWEKVRQTVWFDYGTFSDLREVVNQTDFP